MREITYELSLLDSKGHLRRVEYSPTAARAGGEQVVDVSHEGMRRDSESRSVPAELPKEWKDYWMSWVASLTAGGRDVACGSEGG